MRKPLFKNTCAILLLSSLSVRASGQNNLANKDANNAQNETNLESENNISYNNNSNNSNNSSKGKIEDAPLVDSAQSADFANPNTESEPATTNAPINNFGLEGNNTIFGNNTAKAGTTVGAPSADSTQKANSNTVAAPGLGPSNAAPLNSPVAPLDADPASLLPASSTTAPEAEQPTTAGTADAPETAKPAADGLTDSERELVRSRIEELRPRPVGTYPEEYIIQPGDTLWDISDQLLDDPFWWPKLWSFNPNILNPHLIEPGMRIVFAPSNGVLPPSLSLADRGEFLPVKINETTFKAEQSSKVEAWRDLDGSLISANEVEEFKLIDFYGNQSAESRSFVMLPAIMTSNPPEALGYVAKSAPRAITPAKGGVVYSERDSSFSPRAGERFLTMRFQDYPSMTSRDQVAPSSLWVYSGVLSVVAVEKTGRTRFLIEDSLNGVRPGDRIVPFQNLFLPSDPGEREPKSVAALVVAIGDGERVIAGYGDVVHLSLEGGGVSVDDTIELRSPPGGLGGIDDDFEFVPAGEARVINVHDKWAAAVITRVDNEIIIGSRSGLP